MEVAVGKVQHLERELQIRTEERENYKNKMQLAEKRVAELEQELKAKSESSEPMTDKERATVKVREDKSEFLDIKKYYCFSQRWMRCRSLSNRQLHSARHSRAKIRSSVVKSRL
jgi:hypothetical protein